DTRAERQLAALQAKRCAKLFGDALDDGQHVALFLPSLEQHGELVAPDARDRVASARRLEEALGDRREQLISLAVAERIVHRLEIVEVEEEHGDLLTAPLSRQRVLGAIAKQGAIGEARERIVKGLVHELRLERPVLVFEGQVEVARLEQIARAEQDLGTVERLDEKVARAVRERTLLGVARRIGGEHENR